MREQKSQSQWPQRRQWMLEGALTGALLLAVGTILGRLVVWLIGFLGPSIR
jgi:uncharacterized Tic20 family protein